MKPSMHRQMLMRESAEQMPDLTQTAIGGKRMATRPRKRSEEHILIVASSLIQGVELEGGESVRYFNFAVFETMYSRRGW